MEQKREYELFQIEVLLDILLVIVEIVLDLLFYVRMEELYQLL
jgi:hypothetical protein